MAFVPDILAFRFLFQGLVRNATILLPPNWRRIVQDQGGGLRVILVLGHQSWMMANDIAAGGTGLSSNSSATTDTILIFLDPISLDGQPGWWESGHAGPGGSVLQVDDVALVAHVLHKLRMELEERYQEYLDAAGDASVRPEVYDPKRLYAFGWSSGGLMCYRLAAEANLVDPAAPDHPYFFAAMAVYSATAGGYREGSVVGHHKSVVVNTPAYDISLLHICSPDDSVIADVANVAFDAFAGDGGPSRVELTLYSDLGYVLDAATLARWDMTAETSVAWWLVGRGLSKPALPLPVTLSPDPLTKKVTLPDAVGGEPNCEWWRRIDGGYHTLFVRVIRPAVAVLPDPANSLKTVTTPWPTLFDYILNFFVLHPGV